METWPIGITPWRTGSFRLHTRSFLLTAFRKASLHKIADKAGVTTGAIYTRYKNKDVLFGSLLQDFLIRLFGMPFCRKVHPARGLTHFYRNTLVDFATNLVAFVYFAYLSFCLLYTSPIPLDVDLSGLPCSA